MNKQLAAGLFLSVIFLGVGACATHPAVESFVAEPGSASAPPADAVQYFLPQRFVSMTVQRTRTHRDTVTVRTLPPVPDLARAYYARVPAFVLRDDTFALRTTASGLLTSFAATSKDQTPAVLVDAVQLAGLVPELGLVASSMSVAAPAAAAAAPRRAPVTPPREPCRALSAGLQPASGEPPVAFKASVVFDPTSPADLARAEAELCTRGAHFKLLSVPLGEPAAAPTSAIRSSAAPAPPPAKCAGRSASALHCEPVIYYRRDRPYLFTIYDGGVDAAAGFTLVSAAVIQVPNASPLERLAMTAGPAVATRNSAQFSDGMLLSTSASRPSTALAIASVPVQLAKAIVSIPSALFQFRIDSARDAARLTEAQTEGIKAETARLNALAALREKEISGAPDASDSVPADENSDLQH